MQWQFSKYQKAYSSLNRRDYAFQTAKRAFQRAPRDGGLIPGKSRGSLTKIPPERVSASVNSWINEGRLRLDARERGKKNQPPAPEQGRSAVAPLTPPWSSPATGFLAKLSTRNQKNYTERMRSLPRAHLYILLRPRTRARSSQRRRKEALRGEI